ncbi:pyrophosphatase PpaX [Allobacillus halotolerans]|uniref:Pyrophosphatase PpaX n=1 Tax=Allobacillus halotolerans TaxID=570278 RepID=A0ABS6GQS5_9BACI|nr:pyrophosphatase PpaX [Allobacillus halotolerans]MBU6081433.1 pyrophosphatase PpaX [Allobacillus halotolerans]
MKIETILFDLDGTLLDTNDLIMGSFQHTIKQYADREYTEDEIQAFIGPPLRDSLMKIRPDQVDEMMDTYRSHNLENHDRLVKAFDGVFETVKNLHEKGIKMAIVTSKLRDTAIKGMVLTGIDQFFDVIIGLDDVDNAKPHPEALVEAMDQLKADPMTTMMVGDNSHDLEAAHNAGVLATGVAWSAKGTEFLQTFDPHYMLEHISDLEKIVQGK